MPISSVIFMDRILFLFHIAIPAGGRNFISINVVPSLSTQPPTTPTLYKCPRLWRYICTPGTCGGLQHTKLQRGVTRFSLQPFSTLCSLRHPDSQIAMIASVPKVIIEQLLLQRQTAVLLGPCTLSQVAGQRTFITALSKCPWQALCYAVPCLLLDLKTSARVLFVIPYCWW